MRKEIAQIYFKGLRTDVGPKFMGQDYFFIAENVNYDNIIGADKVLLPSLEFEADSSENIDGIFQFQYIDENGFAQIENIVAFGGTIYKGWPGTLTAIYTGLSAGKVSFSIMNDKLFFANGIENVGYYNGVTSAEMGAPAARIFSPGVLTGTYKYAMTYETSGGEEVIGSYSQPITLLNDRTLLNLPIGYASTTSRKIYRTMANGSAYFLVATIGDNTTLTYIDNVADGSLTTPLPQVNNFLPKVKFIQTNHERLVGVVDSLYPNYAWVTEPEIEVFDGANFLNITNINNDGTPLVGMAQDYSKVIIGSQKSIYVLDASGETPTVSATRSNVGVKDGYSMVSIPAHKDFFGGVMFLSSLNDIRIFNGNFNQPVATSLDNLKADNLSQPIKPTLENYSIPNANIYACFFDYKYHLICGAAILIFDIRIQGWAVYNIITTNYAPLYNYMSVINQKLYAGLIGDARVELFYSDILYREEETESVIASGQLLTSDIVKYIELFQFFFTNSNNAELEVTITIDGNSRQKMVFPLVLDAGVYDESIYSSQVYDTAENSEDYRVIHLNLWARWIQYQIRVVKGSISFRGMAIKWQEVKNKE